MTTKSKLTHLLCILALGAIYPMANVVAEPPVASHSQHAAAANANPEFARTMMESMAKMDHDMAAVPMTGDPDLDFAAMMIPHHQGATDMAKLFLLHGRDPALRRLAGEIILAQDQEIKLLQARLSALRGGAVNPAGDQTQKRVKEDENLP